ncbi:ABC transporter permease [Paenibacillus sp. USDA918EY]|uniref:ABC transporter permease n=1 Tax=Paenibacillus sp. USDA918EY TaxID=2689575 RepID=UPI001F2C1D49|nr:ABC transporter permease [Paenibacillus sp. USDA918EY]
MFGLIKRDFKSKYLNSALGSLWSILNPLAIILVYTLIFSQIMGARLPGDNNTLAYSIYLCAGLLPWQLFSEMLSRLQNIFLEQGSLLKKVSFPRSALPIYTSISASINFSIIFLLYIIFLIAIGKFPGAVFIHVFPLLLFQQVFALGLGIIIGTLNVFFRDIGHILGVILQFWSWLTPLVYARSIIPEKFQVFINWNIMVPLVEGYHNIFLYNKAPDYISILPLCLVSILLLFFSYIVFKKLDKEMVDEL